MLCENATSSRGSGGIRWSLNHIIRIGNEGANVVAKMESAGLNFIEFV